MMKNEKEKMLSGDYYNADDEELVKERDYARNLIFEFNHTRPSEKEKKQKILKQLIVAKGSFYIEAPGNNVWIGGGTIICPGVKNWR